MRELRTCQQLGSRNAWKPPPKRWPTLSWPDALASLLVGSTTNAHALSLAARVVFGLSHQDLACHPLMWPSLLSRPTVAPCCVEETFQSEGKSMRKAIRTASFALVVSAIALGVAPAPAQNSEDVKVVFEHAIPNIKGKRLVAQVVTYLPRSEEHTSELQSLRHLVCRLLLEKKKNKIRITM